MAWTCRRAWEGCEVIIAVDGAPCLRASDSQRLHGHEGSLGHSSPLDGEDAKEAAKSVSTVGTVFECLLVRSAEESASNKSPTLNSYGEPVLPKVRFVVISHGIGGKAGFCALPISIYASQGVAAKRRMEQHRIVYTGEGSPPFRPEERPSYVEQPTKPISLLRPSQQQKPCGFVVYDAEGGEVDRATHDTSSS
jgi:hypothetical protein